MTAKTLTVGRFTAPGIERILEQSNSRFFNVTFPEPDVAVSTEHSLNRYPRKWAVVKQSKPASVYQDPVVDPKTGKPSLQGNPKTLVLKAHFDNSDGNGLLVVLEVC